MARGANGIRAASLSKMCAARWSRAAACQSSATTSFSRLLLPLVFCFFLVIREFRLILTDLFVVDIACIGALYSSEWLRKCEFAVLIDIEDLTSVLQPSVLYLFQIREGDRIERGCHKPKRVRDRAKDFP